jgi:hypothetical protein
VQPDDDALAHSFRVEELGLLLYSIYSGRNYLITEDMPAPSYYLHVDNLILHCVFVILHRIEYHYLR